MQHRTVQQLESESREEHLQALTGPYNWALCTRLLAPFSPLPLLHPGLDSSSNPPKYRSLRALHVQGPLPGILLSGTFLVPTPHFFKSGRNITAVEKICFTSPSKTANGSSAFSLQLLSTFSIPFSSLHC